MSMLISLLPSPAYAYTACAYPYVASENSLSLVRKLLTLFMSITCNYNWFGIQNPHPGKTNDEQFTRVLKRVIKYI